ncbi:acyltransferase family protein [Candidatus Neomarinimicrobiota bacterium]
MNSKMVKERYYDIDWIRILATIAVFLFHSARFFDEHPWHVKNDVISPTLTGLVGFLVMWIMPIFFLLSGQSAYFSIKSRSGWQFINSRIKRLAIPFIFGTLVLIPPQVYLERLHYGQIETSFFSWFPNYFDGWYAFGGNFAWMGLHLWFLEMLFIYSILLLPLFLLIKSNLGNCIATSAGKFFNKPGLIFLLGIPLAYVEVTINPEGFGSRDFGGWNLIQYILVFFYGYIIAAMGQLRNGFIKTRHVALIIGVIGLLLEYIPLIAGHINYSSWMIIRAFDMWAWLIALIGYGYKYLNFDNKRRIILNEAVLPFYILHQTVILIIGYFVIQTNMTPLLKYLIVGVISFSVIVSTYLYLVKQSNLLRFLFGMKSKSI